MSDRYELAHAKLIFQPNNEMSSISGVGMYQGQNHLSFIDLMTKAKICKQSNETVKL